MNHPGTGGMGELMKYDLLLTGGDVLDPAAGCAALWISALRAARSSRSRLIAGQRSAPDDQRQRQAGDARPRRHACPCLCQCARHGQPYRPFCRASGVTTLCDAGSAGSATFRGLRHVLDHEVRTRIRALVNLSAIGITGTSRGGELSHLPYADPEGCARTIIENPDLAFGVKLRLRPRLVWEYSAEPVKLARKAADMAGGVPMMMHITTRRSRCRSCSPI